MPSITEPVTKHQIVLKDGITEVWSNQAMEATVMYRCDWDDRYALGRELLGGYRSDADEFSQFTAPMKCPVNSALYCVGIESVKPLGVKHTPNPSLSKWSPYPYAELTVKFATPDRDWESPTPAGQISYANPILGCKQRIRASSQFVILPQGQLKFETSAYTIDESIGMPLGTAELSFTFSRVPFNPATLLQPYLGKVNYENFLGHDKGELLFDSLDVSEAVYLEGLACEVTITIMARDTSWNSFLNHKGEFEDVIYDASTETPKAKPFAYAKFVDLFKPVVFSAP